MTSYCHPACSCLYSVSPLALSNPQEYWPAHCLVVIHCCHGRWEIFYKCSGIWQCLCVCEGGGWGWCCVMWISHILWRPDRLVHAVSCPLLCSFSLCFPMALARLHAWQTNRCYLPCISSSGPLSLSTNSPLLAHRLQILPASLPLDKSQYQWQNIFYVWNVAHNKQSSIRFV